MKLIVTIYSAMLMLACSVGLLLLHFADGNNLAKAICGVICTAGIFAGQILFKTRKEY